MNEPDLAVITPEWAAPARVRAAFTLRQGGVSRAPFDTLNLGSALDDEPAAVVENRRRVRAALALPAEPSWLEQVHGTSVVTDRDLDPKTEVEPRADAIVTRVPGRVCVVRVADCMPVLLATRDGAAVAAAHAGWRGLAAGVIEATIRALETPPAQLIAWLGPAIGPRHFEVGEEVRRAFVGADAGAATAFVRNERGRWQCDLPALARRRLDALGVTAVGGGVWCTHSDRERFFSYRRDGRCGRMAAFIWLV
jgi:YfiH family protein